MIIRCVILPHIGGATMETLSEMAIMTAKNVVAGIRGTAMPAELKL